MASVHRSLESLSTGHFVFEPNQVLTHDQLNSVAEYGDDQVRLTRVSLLGVGIVCGLRVSASGDTVTVTRGSGITTDGDLVYLDADITFDRFLPYDRSYPAYAPLYTGGDVSGEPLPAFELVRRDAAAERAQPLSALAGAGGEPLANMSVLLLVESYIKDDDLCSGTDCDNLGRQALHTTRFLLLDRNRAEAFATALPTPAAAAAQLPELFAERPVFGANVDSPGALAGAFRAACGNTHAALDAALARLTEAGSAVLGEDVAGARVTGWQRRLQAQRDAFANSGAGIQYYYDFLKDLVDAYNELRELLATDGTVCGPPLDAFPKHLLLGDLGNAPRGGNRTGFYPSPVTSRGSDALRQVRFLLSRLDTMIARFQPTHAAAVPIRITPSAFEDRPLAERAVPIYYQPGTSDPIHTRWNHALSEQGRENAVYSYHATTWAPRNAAGNPLSAQIGRFPFFRIEGHVGKSVAAAMRSIEAEISARNLPFAVRSVMLGGDRQRVVKKPGTRFTDLHHLHHLVRTDVALRLEQVQSFNQTFKQQVDDAITTGKLTDIPEENEGVPIRAVTAEKTGTLAAKATTARNKIGQGYAAYRADPSWRADVTDTLRAAGELKSQLSPVVKTEFTTPYDSLIASPQIDWLPWLDEIIGRREEQDDEKLVFRRFVQEHPQVEHFAGVLRGGTFVLAYDEGGTVVADFMLPYYCPEAEKEEQAEPPLQRPEIRPPFVIDRGVRVIPSRNTFFGRKFAEVEPRIAEKIDLQTRYFDVFRQSYTNVIKDSLQIVQGTDPKGGVTGGLQFNDKYLELLVEENRLNQQAMEVLKQQAAQPGLPEETKSLYETQLREAEKGLAQSIEKTTDYVSRSNVDVAAGSEGFTAVVQATSALAKLSESATMAATTTNLEATMNNTANIGLKAMLGGVLRR